MDGVIKQLIARGALPVQSGIQTPPKAMESNGSDTRYGFVGPMGLNSNKCVGDMVFHGDI